MLVARGQADAAVELLEDLLKQTPAFETAYVTLAKIHFSAGQTARRPSRSLERLLQRNPDAPGLPWSCCANAKAMVNVVLTSQLMVIPTLDNQVSALV